MLEFNQKKFLEDVRKFMKKHKLSCRVFAALSGVAFSTMYRAEQNAEITVSTIRKLEKAMRNYKPENII